MAARVEVKIGDVSFKPVEAKYSVSRDTNKVGHPMGDSLMARAYIWLDAHDQEALAQADMIKLWKKATDPKDNPEKVSITYYADGEKVLSSVEFMGWISIFQTVNPTQGTNSVRAGGDGSRGVATESMTGYNNILYLELVAALDAKNVAKHKLTK